MRRDSFTVIMMAKASRIPGTAFGNTMLLFVLGRCFPNDLLMLRFFANQCGI